MLGKYEVIGELGRGGMGVVLLARDPDLNRRVALKVLQEELSADPQFVRRLENEARAVARLFHPHVLPINTMVRHNGRLILEMPYIPSGSLAKRITVEGPQCPEVALYAADILDALTACHGSGIIHRDVKPSNILIDPHGRALLTDFGLAKNVDVMLLGAGETDTITSTFIGTPRYAPLEAWGGAEPSPAWDLYAIGVILFEALSGRDLVTSDTFLGYLRAKEQGLQLHLETAEVELSEPMRELLKALLAPLPEERASSAESALKQLTETPEYKKARDEDEANTARLTDYPRWTPSTDSSTPRAWPSGHRRRLTGLIGAVVVIVAVVLGVGLGQRGTGVDRAPLQTDTVAAGWPAFEHLLHTRIAAAGSRPGGFAVHGDGDGGLFGTRAVLTRNAHGYSVLMFGGRGLSALELSEASDGSFLVTGIWGGFLDDGTLACVSGEAVGTGSWLVPDEALLLSLESHAPGCALQWTQDLTLSTSSASGAELLQQFEEDDLAVPLLRLELAPRDERWQTVADQWLPAVPDSSLRLLMNPDEETKTVSRGAWQTARRGGIPGFSHEGRGLLFGVALKDRLVLRLEGDSLPESRHALAVCIQTGTRIPRSASTRYQAKWLEGEWTESTARRGGKDLPWECTWTVRRGDSAGAPSLEVEILYQSVDATTGPTQVQPWRMNLQVWRAHGEQAFEPCLLWGAPDISRIEHGMQLGMAPDLPL